MHDDVPVVVIGAGPVGLAAAAHLLERGLEPLVLEAGPEAGAAVSEWAHVRLFSPWSELVDQAAARLLERTGWQPPDRSRYPTGGDWVAQYLRPLASALGDRVRFGVRVSGVARRGRDRVVDAGRDTQPLTVHTISTGTGPGIEERITARAVVDASGTWSTPNPLGADGYPASGERAAAERISYRMPDLTDPAVRGRYGGRRVAVVGSGHSALTALVAFSRLATEEPGTHVTWVLRRGEIGDTFGGGQADRLPARGALGRQARLAAQNGHIDVVAGFRTEAVERIDDGRLVLRGEDGRRLSPVDEIVTLTGFRPDLSLVSELRLMLDERLEAPVALAPMIDPNVHSCGTVPPHGADTLAHPERGVYLAGMKSYGRAPTFLALTGYEQVRSVAAALAGDHEAAARVDLTLPETGVCSGGGVADEDAVSCCGPAPEPVAIEVLSRP